MPLNVSGRVGAALDNPTPELAGADHSAFAPENFTALRHFSISCVKNFPPPVQPCR